MNEKITQLVQEVIDLAAQGAATPSAIHAKGIEAKQAIWDEVDNLQLAINILDGIVPYKASGLPWTIGWVRPSATGADITTTWSSKPPVRPTAIRNNRILKVLSLAQEALDSGRTTITTDEIATTLQDAGDNTARRSLHTAVGNILNRTGHWKRVRTGEYEYQAERGV